jgi:3D (Asp-Asp-Asp) domain-containing protein
VGRLIVATAMLMSGAMAMLVPDAAEAQVVTDPIKPKPTPSPVESMGIATRPLRMLDPLGLPAWPCKPAGTYRITGYVKGAPGLSSHTYDGTSVWTQEKIVAASWHVPMNTLLRVAGLDYSYRVADRGALGNMHIDVLVNSYEVAYSLGPYAEVCVVRWGGG